MLLKVFTPMGIIIKNQVDKFIGENEEGRFGILPKHIDFVTSIVPSILSYIDQEGEGYIAVDEGILIKEGDQICISVREAFEKRELQQLREEMEANFQKEEEEETQSGQSITKLELGIVKSFYNLKIIE